MKRKTLTTAVLAGLTGVAGMAGVANAVHLNPDGLGQVLLYPYYSAKGGNDTLISVVNTTDQAKSVKIRFIEALNSREVLDFNIYMSAFDVWTAAITATAAGGGKVVISDRTCTVPNFLAGLGGATVDDNGSAHVAFLPNQYTGTRADGGPSGVGRTASGYLEIIEMGTLVDASAAAATHTAGEPANCAALNAQWNSGGLWLNNPLEHHTDPSGGLFGAASIINVEDGTMFSYTADALDAFAVEIMHTNPGSLDPSLAFSSTTSNVFLPGAADVDTQTWGQGFEAVSATILHSKIMNEYLIGGGASARSEWVVTFPTKRFYADAAPGGPNPGLPAAIPPFSETWTQASPGACENIDISVWDREERRPGPGDLLPSPLPETPVGFQLCREANVARFSNDGSLPDVAEITKEEFRDDFLGYVNFDLSDVGFNSGWARFDFDVNPNNVTRPAESGDQYVGLPAIGFWVNTFTNGTLQDADGTDVLANYGGSFRHRGTRTVITGS